MDITELLSPPGRKSFQQGMIRSACQGGAAGFCDIAALAASGTCVNLPRTPDLARAVAIARAPPAGKRAKMLRIRHFVLTTLAVAALAAVPARAGDEKPAPVDDQKVLEMMQVYEAAARPGPAHELIARTAGKWQVVMKSWMDPASPPMVSEGVEEGEMILGGRYLKSTFKGETFGGVFEGLGLLGYDNLKRKYVGIWIDSMSTGMMTYEGDYDPATRELVCQGDFVDAASGEMRTARLVTRFLDDHHVFEMWGPDPSGEQVKWMEMTYTRLP
jgi:hypothetical protein